MSDPFNKIYRTLTDAEQELMDEIKNAAEKLHSLIGKAESVGTAGDSIQLAKHKLQESVFWAIDGIMK